jgi:hypothetical protein
LTWLQTADQQIKLEPEEKKRNADEVQRSEMKEVMCQTPDQMICRSAELLSLDWNTPVWEIIKPDLIQEQLLCTT